MDFKFIPHALEEMQERKIPLQTVLDVLNHPEEIVPEKNGRVAYQAQIDINSKPYIVRAIPILCTRLLNLMEQ